MIKNIAKALILPALMICAASQAAIVAELHVTNPDGKQKQTVYISDGKVSISSPDDPQGIEVLYDSRTDQIDVIQHTERSYSSLDRATVDGLAKQAAGMRSVIAENTTADQQKQLAEMLGSVGLDGLMGEKPKAKARFVTTDKQRNISGIDCQVVRIIRGEQLETVMCIASRKALKLPEAEYRVLRSMLAYSSHLAGQAAGLLGDIGGTLPDLGAGEIKGLPIALTDLDDGVIVVLQGLAPVKNETRKLAVPAGYSKTTLPDF